MGFNDAFRFIFVNFKKRNYVLTGRATTGLLLILKSRQITGKNVLCPVNICYSIVNAITLTNNNPVFIDVDPQDGNTRIEYIKEKMSEDVAAILVPHMYGNPCVDIKKIKSFCGEKKTLLIEDCAVSIGGQIDNGRLGEFGDYSLLSFGHNKVVDIGVGGMVISNASLGEIARLNSQLPDFNKKIDDKINLYSKLYRDIYYSNYYDELLPRFAVFNDFFQDIYLFKADSTVASKILRQFDSLENQLATREKTANFFNEEINFGDKIRKYPYLNGAVYWRYNVLINDPSLKKRIINKLLENNILVSTWYPPVNRLFGDESTYKNAQEFAKKILNLSVTINLRKAKKIAKIINNT